MKDFVIAFLPWFLLGICIIVVCVNEQKKKQSIKGASAEWKSAGTPFDIRTIKVYELRFFFDRIYCGESSHTL